MPRHAAVLLAALAFAAPAFSQPLSSAVRQAQSGAAGARYALELRRISRALEKETDHRSLSVLSKRGRAAIAALRAQASFSADAVSALDRLDGLYASLPSRTWAKPYGEDLAAVIALTPSWVADQGGTAAQMRARLEKSLDLPDPNRDFSLFPKDVPLARFKKLCPIVVFLMKHRMRRPPFVVQTTPADLIAGKQHVQIGVQVEGVVTSSESGGIDGDYCFDLGNLHLEITPEWRLTHKHFPKPVKGQRVRVTGWSYFDIFHPAEHDYDPRGLRYTDWEVHPVQQVEVLP